MLPVALSRMFRRPSMRLKRVIRCTSPQEDALGVHPSPSGKSSPGRPLTFGSKNIVIQGAGIDQTIIIDETGAGYNERPFWVQCQEGKPFRITGFTFTGMKKRSSTEPAIQIRGYCSNWRIDHSKFDLSQAEMGTQGRGILTSGPNYGLIDHNIFLNALQGVAVGHDGDASWQRPLSLGTGDAVYIEDNLFDYSDDYAGDGANDAYNGARYVMRHNSITNARMGHHGFDSGGYRSPHSFEIYSNTITFTDPQSWYPMRFRGGTGVIFNNTWIGDYNPNLVIGVVNYRTCCCNWCTNVEPDAYGYPCDPYCSCASPLHTNCSHWGRCDGNNPLDGNLEPSGYPCKDQVGRSTDSDGDGIQNQEPLYEWNNTFQGQDADITVNDPWGCTSPSMHDHLKEGRDFINDTPRPNYVPYVYPHPLAAMDNPEPCAKGDMNCDRVIDRKDAQLWIDVFLGKEQLPEIIGRADVNGDTLLDALDLQWIVTAILERQ